MLPIAPVAMSQTLTKAIVAKSPSLLTVFSDLLNYRQMARQLALEEKRLDAGFKLRSQQLSHDHQQKMAQLQLLRERCEQHYRLLGQESTQQHHENMETLNQRGELISMLGTPGFSIEDRALVLEVIKSLNEQLEGASLASLERLAVQPQVTLD